MKTFAFDFSSNKILSFSSKAAAMREGNGRTLASTAEELASNSVTMGQMVGMYNKFVPAEQRIVKFESKAIAAKRLISLAESKATPVKETEEHKDMAATHTSEKKEKAPKAAKESTGKRGRASGFAGKIIRAEVDENPRREGTGGHRSMEIILAHPKGISYEDFLAAGGRRQDLVWDLDKKAVSVH
jgi:hypothetical protein